MFALRWEPAAFDRMQALITGNPAVKAGFAYSLETLALELTERADDGGGSRMGSLRFGTAGVLSVFVRVDSDARVVDVNLERRHRPGA